MNVLRFITLAITVTAFLLFAGPRGVLADDVVNVTVNTSSLGAGNSEVFFVLTGTGGNSSTLTNISLGAGRPEGVDALNTTGTGANAGNGLSSQISLNDGTYFLNVFAQSFTAGTELSFVLDLTANVASPTPDQFSMAILDPNGNPIPTSDPTGFDNLFTINLDSNTTTSIYSDLASVAPIATPEPATFGLMGLGVALVVTGLLRRNRHEAM